MTSKTPAAEPPVDGGLDEPTGLEPEQGALALAQPEDEHTQADWEKATAAVLRKARRMRDEDDDALCRATKTQSSLVENDEDRPVPEVHAVRDEAEEA